LSKFTEQGGPKYTTFLNNFGRVNEALLATQIPGRRMPLFSLSFSPQSYFSTSPLQDFPAKVNNFPFPSTSAPVSTLNFSPFSKRLLGNGIWVSQRNKFHAKSADTEPNTSEPSTQSSQGNVTVSSSGGNSSTSFLSLLCPLLKLFSVSTQLKFETFMYLLLKTHVVFVVLVDIERSITVGRCCS
jgi:hypothetical protein